jgi:hypothetical protein
MQLSISAFSHPNFTGQNLGTKGMRGPETNRASEGFYTKIAGIKQKTTA